MSAITAFHIDDLSVWVRQQHLPRGTPVVIHHDGRVVGRSRELRKGLAIGEPLDRAARLFPDASFHPHEPDLNGAMWEDILYMLADLSPRLLSPEPGWALMQVYDRDGLAVLNRAIGGQVGVAPRRFAAMIAALNANPGEIYFTAPTEVRGLLNSSSVRHLAAFGFDAELIERLELFGLGTLGRASSLTRRQLTAQFGPAGGLLHDQLHPRGEEGPVPLFQPPQVIAATYEFEFPSREPAELLPVLHHLVEEGTGRLNGLRAQLLTLRLRGSGREGNRIMRRVLKSATARAAHFMVVAERLIRLMVNADAPVDAMTFELGGLVRGDFVQGGLFQERPAVQEAVKTLHRRFPGRIFRAVITDIDAYLPEDGVRLEPYPTSPPARRRKG